MEEPNEIDKNKIIIARALDIDVDQVQKLYNVISLDDLATLTSAAANSDFETIHEIYSDYREELNKEPVAPTGEKEMFIPDDQVKAAIENVHEMQNGGKSKRLITELNAWQRRMFFGYIDPNTAKMMQHTLDLSPIACMQKYNELHGYGQSEIVENELSLQDMMESILEKMLNANEDYLHGIDDKKEEPKDPEKEDEKSDEKEKEKKSDKKDDEKTKKLIDSIVKKTF